MHNSSFDIHRLPHIRAAAALLQAAAMVCAPPSCASTAVNTQLLSSAVPINPRGQLLLCCCQYCGMCCCPAGNCCDRFLCIPLVPSSKGCLQHSGAIHHNAGPPALQALQPRQNLPASQGPGLAEGSIITHTSTGQRATAEACLHGAPMQLPATEALPISRYALRNCWLRINCSDTLSCVTFAAVSSAAAPAVFTTAIVF